MTVRLKLEDESLLPVESCQLIARLRIVRMKRKFGIKINNTPSDLSTQIPVHSNSTTEFFFDICSNSVTFQHDEIGSQ